MEHSQDVLDNVSGSGSNFSLSPQAISFLTQTRKWVNFLAILGFIAIGLMVISGLFFGTMMGAMMGQTGMTAAGGSAFFGVFYIILALIYFFPVMYLYKFGTKLKTALANRDSKSLEQSFENLKSHYKFVGIVAIIGLSFYAFSALMMILVGVGSMSSMF